MMLDSHNPTYGLGSHITGKCVIALDGRLDLSQSSDIERGISSSFIGKYGSIKYWIEAEIQRPLFTVNNKIKTKLNVDVPLVCNDLMLPLKLSARKNAHIIQVPIPIVLDSHNQTYGLGSDVKGKCVIALDGELGLSQWNSIELLWDVWVN
ncbi:unnamed protein product [Oppiella nova]|uniref:Uncharacterized protein n=1 Tax=Oppiella nova TaxID=334625 RepID=A0A7R9M1D3_9ACAR|nr:unnamed protein product [Oppiella nova]CAG2168967.1 unnamed protein product [Oppiella nova]